jgi:hypothetical protein
MRTSVRTTSGPFSATGREQRVEIVADGCDLEVVLRLEQPPKPLADEVLILGEHDPDRHREGGYGCRSGAARPDRRRQREEPESRARRAACFGLLTLEAARGREGIAVALERRPDVILL